MSQCANCGRGKESVSDLYTCTRCSRTLCERCGEAEDWPFNDECCRGCLFDEEYCIECGETLLSGEIDRCNNCRNNPPDVG